MVVVMLLAGAGVGAGMGLSWSGLRPAAPSLRRQLNLLDPPPSARRRVRWHPLGGLLAAVPETDLRVLQRDRSWQASQQTRHTLLGFAVGTGALFTLATSGAGLPAVSGLLLVMFPLLAARLSRRALIRRAAHRRQQLRGELACYLELIALGIAAGRGVNEALVAAAAVGHSQLFGELGTVLDRARLSGVPQPRALRTLADELDLPELRDVAAALNRATSEGAVAYETFRAKAGAVRSRLRSDLEGDAAANTESMTVGPNLILLGYLLWLLYPALIAVLAVPAP